MAKTVKFDEKGMLDKTQAPPAQLEHLFAPFEPLIKYNHCHGAKGQFCSSGSSGGGGGGAAEESSAPTHPGNLNGEEYKAVREYCYTEYAFVNSYLRNNPGKMPEKYQDMTKNLDSAIAKQPELPEGTKLYRRLDYKAAFGKKKPEELIGTVITDNGFMSTSTWNQMPDKYGSTMLTITVPKGYKGLDVLKIKGTAAAQAEKEIILPRGARLQVVSASQTAGGFLGMGKKGALEVQLLPNTEKSILKYNHCHGAKGQFCSSGGTGGGGGGFQNTSGELTEEEQAAVDSYASVGFKDINDALRGKKEMTPEIQNKVKLLDSAMDKNPLSSNQTVFRGIKSTKFLKGEEDPKKLIGMTITDNGFMSTSANTQTAASFSIGKGGVNMTIHVPKGTPSLDIRNHIFSDQAFEEHEVLLKRNVKLKVTRAEKQGSQLHLTAEVV